MIVLGRICLLCCFFSVASRVSCYDEDFPDGYHYQRAFPEEIMVDVINNFGLALLEAHNEGNEDNMALSPYGATSVLVALKEGLRGYAAREIETSVHLPADLSVIRIGLRDVHRHLKSYFIPKEGFLAGLTLSNDKVELLQNYEGTLRFYGYDLESFNNPLYPDVFEDANTTSSSFLETTTEIATSPTTNLISTSVTPETTVAEDVTGENVISTTETISMTTEKVEQSTGNESSTSGTEITSTTEAATTEENIFTTTAETSIQGQVTKNVTRSTTEERKEEQGNRITTQSLEVKAEEENMEAITVPQKTSTASTSSTDDVTSEDFPEVTTDTMSSITSPEDVDGTESTTQTQSSPVSTTPLQTELTTSLGDGKNNSDLNRNETANDAVTSESHVVPVNSTSQNVTEEDKESTTDVTVTSITTSVSTSTARLERPNDDENIFEKPLNITTSKFTTTSDSYEEEESSYSTESTENSTGNEVYDYTSEYISTESGEDLDYTTEESDEEEEGDKTRKSRSIIDYLIARYHDDFHANNDKKGRRFDYEPEESLNFFVYGRIKEPNVNFMNYDAVLPFAYLPVLDALALSFPLDSSEYYLLLLLPVEVNGIDRLVYDLKKTSSLREIIGSLNFTRVKAVIPSFMLKGYVILTSTLQKLGVRKIFEPRHADFSLMTKEPNLYVTNIEQSVTVTIRNYIDPEKLSSHRNSQRFRTVEFKADHPFLYFVMDSRIHVTLMAGKIVNPLNSRIR